MLNKITQVDSETMTMVEDLFLRLSGKMTKINLTEGYWQILVAQRLTPDGQYEFLPMRFGMVNSGTTPRTEESSRGIVRSQ